MANAVSKKPAIIDFGYATNLDSYHPGHGRSGIKNLMQDLDRLPGFLGLPGNGEEFRARFFSGADQPRIPGLTRGIVIANANTFQRQVMEQVGAQGDPSFFQQAAKGLGLKPARLQSALQPERDARLAKQRRQPYGTPIPVPPPTPKPKKTPVGMFRVRPGTPTGMRRVKPGVDEFTGLTTTPTAAPLGKFGPRTRALAADLPGATPAGRLSLAARMQRIMERSGNEDMSLEAALRLARNEQRGFSSWKD